MKKIVMCASAVMFIVAFMVMCADGYRLFKLRDKSRVRAEITSIGTPDGDVYGTFKDPSGEIHKEHFLYSLVYAGNGVNTERFIGRKVTVLYDEDTGECSYYGIGNIMICAILCITSALLFRFTLKKIRRQNGNNVS